MPGKDDYTQLMGHRTILLLRCMSKVANKVVTAAMSEEAERGAQLSDRQFRC
jgi:hypothetical protein